MKTWNPITRWAVTIAAAGALATAGALIAIPFVTWLTSTVMAMLP